MPDIMIWRQQITSFLANGIMNRIRGIAVFADENRSRQRLTHYFDISDTHESRYSRTVPIWDMRQEYEADVIETLESTFGEIENKSSLAEAIMGAARNAAEDNIPDYLQDLYYATEGSFLEEVDNDIVASIYKNVVTNSVAYMMMSRLGVDTDGYFELDDFRDVTNFNTQETLNALGFATSDIAEMGLTEISKTITALNRQNRIIVGQDRNEYNKVENNDERSLDNERTDLHDGGRLQPSEPETSTAAGSDAGQIRSDEERVSEGTSQSPLLQSPDEGRTDTALGGSGTESQQDGGNNSEPDGTERGSDRTDESGGYDEMGSSDELPSQFGTGNRESGSDIRLEYYDRTHEDKSLPFFGRDEVINEILRTTPHLSASLEEIKDYYERKSGCYFNVNTTKTPASMRQVPMLGFVKEAFEHEKQKQEDLGLHCEVTIDGYTDFIFINRFGQAQHQATLNKAIRRIIRDCNDEQFLHSDEPDVLLPHFSCHSLRHTFTTRMCEAGVNIKVIQDALGHSDISTTLNIYADVTKEMKAAEFKGLDSYFKV